ncbi:hypothetical protein HNQ91_005915 [Filimonas zeae]|nr:hypothetical protein [Filimonas zeae]MDR6342828.1 hypothetical protein [Filimonas zeae]
MKLLKHPTMKKVLFVLALGAFAACGNGSNTEATADSTKTDSLVTPAPVVAPTADSTVKADSAAVVAPVADSAAKH